MYRFFQYLILFLLVALLQVFFFDNLAISTNVSFFIYLTFLVLLPLDIKGYALLLLGALTGVTMDFFMGTPALNTIASTFTAFCRPSLVRLLVGREMVEEGGMPNINKIGRGKFLRYMTAMAFIHCAVFFLFESLSFTGAGYLALRIVLSTIATSAVVYFCQLLFVINKSKI